VTATPKPPEAPVYLSVWLDPSILLACNCNRRVQQFARVEQIVAAVARLNSVEGIVASNTEEVHHEEHSNRRDPCRRRVDGGWMSVQRYQPERWHA
jgi:hypothetical protein